MSFRFRFPAALLHYIDSDQGDIAYKKAREWSTPEEGETRKYPSKKEVSEYLNTIIEERKRETEEDTL